MGNLDFSMDVLGGTTGRMLCKPYRRMYVEPPDICYFLNTLWIILGRTRQPLNHWARTTERTPLCRMSAAFLGL
jgi:hypothetical protein